MSVNFSLPLPLRSLVAPPHWSAPLLLDAAVPGSGRRNHGEAERLLRTLRRLLEIRSVKQPTNEDGGIIHQRVFYSVTFAT